MAPGTSGRSPSLLRDWRDETTRLGFEVRDTPHQCTHIGTFEVVGVLPIVMQHGVVQRIDALERLALRMCCALTLWLI